MTAWFTENIEVITVVVTTVVYLITRFRKLNKYWAAALLLVAKKIEDGGGDTKALREAIGDAAGTAGGTVKEIIKGVAEKVDAKKMPEHKGKRFLRFLLKVAIPFMK